MDRNKIKTLMVLGIVILLSEYVSATGLATAVRGLWKGIRIVPYLIGESIAEAFKLVAKGWIVLTARTGIKFLEGIFENMTYMMTLNPPMDEVLPGMIFFMKIIAPFYIFAILFIAIYILLGSGSAVTVAKAKSMLTKLIVGLILLSISPVFLEILLIISENATKALVSTGASMGIEALRKAIDDMFFRFTVLAMIHREGGLEIFALNTVLASGLIVMLYLRQVMVVLFGMLLPVSFILYFFYPTKGIGKDLLVQTFLWAFMPVAWALSLVVIGFGMASIPSYVPEFYICLGSFFFFIGSPMLVMGVGDWLANLVFIFELLQAAPLSIGAVVLDETMK